MLSLAGVADVAIYCYDAIFSQLAQWWGVNGYRATTIYQALVVECLSLVMAMSGIQAYLDVLARLLPYFGDAPLYLLMEVSTLRLASGLQIREG
jgi:hypothetical protein